MKTNILKKWACLLLIGGLFAPTYQIKAGDLGDGLTAIFILAAMAQADKQVKELSETKAHDIILAFFNAETRGTITPRELSLALRKFGMPYFDIAFFVLNQRPDKTYQAIQRNLNKLPEDLQELFKAISEEEFCEDIRQLKSEKPVQVTEETTQEQATEQTEVASEVSA